MTSAQQEALRQASEVVAVDDCTQCLAAGVPVFVKQMGSSPTLRSGSGWGPIRDKKGGDPAEWPAQLRVRQIPEAAA